MTMILNQVTVPCDDFEASLKFYVDLGLILIVKAAPNYARFETAPNESSTLSIEHGSRAPGKGPVIYFDHESPTALDEHVMRLQEAGIPISDPADKRWGWREARVLDPAGNEICLMYAGSNRHWPEWRV